MPDGKRQKIMLLGSGALKIGEAGEFDYAGSQAIKALKEENKEVILVNPNIATIQTSENMADQVYFLPVNPYFVGRIIRKERPDGLLLSFGGQTALNCGVALYREGILQKYRVPVLGTPVPTIIATEDRELFTQQLKQIKVKTPTSLAVTNLAAAIKAAKKIGYPVMMRSAYALGGLGSGVAYNEGELTEMAGRALAHSRQLLIEEYLKHWKEIEYEVVRDRQDNCLTVCNMENLDPMGIHTGESIVVAPSQTLNNHQYHYLRQLSIRVVRRLGIIGECNIQFALDPHHDDYRVIEVNARLSRSSALASKATGYPLAYIGCKLALGRCLNELPNSVTRTTPAFFEPALDYLVLKFPRWDLSKFKNVSPEIGSEMKSVGEVMAIGRSFEEVLQKAVRMLEIGREGILDNGHDHNLPTEKAFDRPTPLRVFAVARALARGASIDEVHRKTGIDRWFIYKINNIVRLNRRLARQKFSRLGKDLLLSAKKYGFSDKYLAGLYQVSETTIRRRRRRLSIIPYMKQIDTVAAEYPARTNYLYLTYQATADDPIRKKNRRRIMVLGSGVYRIGSSVEFDWCGVHTIKELKAKKYGAIMINCNPETVSTDYDIGDTLYFEELTFERVMDIYEKERPRGVIVSVGGQTPNNLALKLAQAKVRLLGTAAASIDQAENRYKFSRLLDELHIDQPAWKELRSLPDALAFAEKAGYPVLVRPSYVLSGQAMNVAFSRDDLQRYLKQAGLISPDYPIVISKFEENAKEIEMDAVAAGGRIIVWAISEHVENAGVHSGDATIVFPPQKLYLETIRRIKKATALIARRLKISGPFNIQFLARDNMIKVIECNLRASRSFPFVSKVAKVNFIDLATRVMLGEKIREKYQTLDFNYVGVKAPQFSFQRLKGADPIVRVEMGSTGEVAALGDDLEEAFLKSILSTGFRWPRRNILISLGGEQNKVKLLETIKQLPSRGFRLFGTANTAKFLRTNGLPCRTLYKIHEQSQPNILDYLKKGKLDLVINITDEYVKKVLDDDYTMRRYTVDYNVPLLTNRQLAKLFIDSLVNKRPTNLKIKAWSEYK
ncbi:MAG: carbamoyl-phosphate synthase (glutamine-hydrolyzing) large subunit [Patescibacteria group bacterium]